MGKLRYILWIAALSTWMVAAQAQEEAGAETKVEAEAIKEETQSSGNKYKGVEKLMVTGSHIRRSDVEGPSPVVVIDREKIEASGFNSVGQLLRASTASPFGGGTGSVNLRGIGSSRTLVLLNGQRLPQSGSSFSTGAIDTTFIPLAAVERIEILKDGASATYGSDALGGVVNIITRKDLDGVSFATKYDISENIGGDVWRSALAWGKSASNYNIMSSLQYTFTQHRRTSASSNLRDLNDGFFFSQNYVNDSGQTVAGPNCGLVDSETGRCGEKRAFDQAAFDSHEITSATDMIYKVGSDTEVYTTILAQYYKGGNTFPAGIYATPGPGGGVGIRLTGAETPASWDPLLADYNGGDTSVFGVIPSSDLSPNVDTDKNYLGGLVVGARGYVGDSDWQWDVSLNNQINIATSLSENAVLYSAFREKLISGDYNPFDDGTNRDLSGVAVDLRTRNRFVTNWAEAKFNGEIGGGLSAAAGVSAAHFEYKDDRDNRIVNQEIMGLTGANGGGERQLYAVFAELGYNPLDNLEIQLALRNDLYSDFGSTFNPRLAVRYQPTDWWMIRTSAGTGFQAPLLQDTYGPQVNGFEFQVDRFRCRTIGNNDPNHPECRNRAFNSLTGANPDLKEETSVNFNFGMVFEPIRRLNFSVDYWRINVNDTIDTDIDGLLEVEDLNGGTVPAGTPGQINRDGPGGEIQNFVVLQNNIGNEAAHGIDVDLNYTFKTGIGDIYLGSEHTYMFHYWESFYEELGRENVINQYNKPRWKNNTTLGYSLGDFAFRIVARTTAGTEKRVETSGFIATFTQYDMTFDYRTPWGAKVQVGAVNAFNQRPDEDETQAPKLNRNLFRAFRTSFLSYRQDF